MISDEERQTHSSYEKIAPLWAKKRHRAPDFWLEQFKYFQKLLPTGKVIDIGCGPGRDAALFVPAGYDYFGVDNSEAQLLEAKKFYPAATFQVANMHDLRFAPGYFDGFWAVASFLHIPKREIQEVLKGVRRVVRCGGIGFISMKEGEGERVVKGELDGDERFFAFYALDEFYDVLIDCDYEVIAWQCDYRERPPSDEWRGWLKYFVKVR